MGLTHFKNNQIDRENWLEVHRSEKEAIYSHPTFLDCFSPNWEAFIEEGEIYMPLPVKKIIGIKYLVQPAFCQQIGPFGPEIGNEFRMQTLLKVLSKRFPRINIYLNQKAKVLNAGKLKLKWRSNYCLDLNRNYSAIRLSYSTNLKRNLKKALKANLEFKELNTQEAYDFYLSNTLDAKKIKVIKEKHKSQLLNFLLTNGDVKFSNQGIIKDHKLIAVVVWASLYNRTYYVLSATNPQGKEVSAAAFLIDRFLQLKDESMKTLDFEGSMIPGLEQFYKSFGAERHAYAHVKKKGHLGIHRQTRAM